ncbi:hypothetical protein EDD86DRAFT_200265 [Gorgonomyces haynaldii]|nr:hypothetical protein EDD86DRAFT_200265 [Gorgonomyces haynaldii]
MALVETANSDFTLDNIPFGIIEVEGEARPASAIGKYAVDLKQVAALGLFRGPLLSQSDCFQKPTLNAFMALGRQAWRECRSSLQQLLTKGSVLDTHAQKDTVLIPLEHVKNLLPIEIGDYTDFYASKEHAFNVGVMFRGKENALNPNWVHLPVGYHGRASSVVVSSTPVIRPSGLILNADKKPEYHNCRKLDIELEMGFVVGVGNKLGEPISIDDANEHIFGAVLLNDWSARDIQAFEYVPLGPFLGKNFSTTISPWIVTLDALEPFLVQQPVQDPKPASYLDNKGSPDAYDIKLSVHVKPHGASDFESVSQSNLKYMYWSFKQQLAHHTVNGCNMRTGDLCGTGTISGPTEDSLGSFLEMTTNGQKPFTVQGQQRTFLLDGDEVILRGRCQKDGKIVGFGDCHGKILPAPKQF